MRKRQPTPRPKAFAAMTTGERVCAFIEEYCRVPEGKHVGEKLVLDPFQRQFILDVYDNPAGTSRAILSIARKNGKTALIAAIALAHTVGPVARRNSQVVSGARSRDQAAIVFKLMSKMVMLEPRLQPITRIVPSSKTVIGLPLNVEYTAISAEAKTAHGKSPVVAILDELGQVKGPQDDFVDAIETSQGAYDDALLIAISTQAASDSDLFSVWIDDALDSGDPHIVCRVYEAPKDCELMNERAWRAANPALGRFRSIEDMRRLAEKASRMPSFAATFRNLNLNQRVEVRAPFVSRDVWIENGAPPAAISGRPKLWAGLDLSSVADLTAFVGVTEDFDVHCAFWLPEEGIVEKSRADRTPWNLWAEQGFIRLTPGRSVQYSHVAKDLRQFFEHFSVQAVGFDRYNMKFLRPWLEREGFSERESELFKEFGQGFVSMFPALRELESALLNRKMRHGMHPVLTACAMNAVTISDTTGNRKFAKGRSTGRIDGMVALAQAIGVMPMVEKSKPEPTLLFV